MPAHAIVGVIDLAEAKRQHSRYSKGARDEAARLGHRLYERQAKRRRVRPDSGHQPRFVSPEVRQEVIDHLRSLQASGVGVNRLYAVTGVSIAALQGIRSGKTSRVSRRVANVVLAVHLERIPKKRKGGFHVAPLNRGRVVTDLANEGATT